MGRESRLRVNRLAAKPAKYYWVGPVLYVAGLALLMSISAFLG